MDWTRRPVGPLTFLIFCAVLVVPPGAARTQADHPEALLLDATGDETYGPQHLGPKNRDYVDVEAAWFEFSPSNDTIALVVQFHDTSTFQTREEGWVFFCEFSVETFAEGNRTGRLVYWWKAVGPGNDFATEVKVVVESASAATYRQYSTEETVSHDFGMENVPHGRVEFVTARARIVQLSDELRGPSIMCSEWFDPAHYNPAIWVTFDDAGFNIFDEGTGNGSVQVASLEPMGGVADTKGWPVAEWVVPAIGLAVLVKILLGWLLYARIHRQDVLKNPIRSRLHEMIRQNPGIRQRQLMRLSGLAPGRLAHHLQTLEGSGLIKRVPFHGFTSLFLAGTDPATVHAVAALQSRAARQILEEVRRRPGVTARQLAAGRQVHPSSILHHVRRLVEAGVLVRTRTRAGLELRATTTL